MKMTSPHWPLLARVLLALLFISAGANKLASYAGTLKYFGAVGLPLPEVVLPLTILLEIGGGIALVAGWRLGWVAATLAVFTLLSAFIGHRFWAAEGPQFTAQLNHFLKNLAIVGAFILLVLQARQPLADPR